jgi:hypothetical protein
VEDLGARMRSRTVATGLSMDEVGTFNDSTRPTGEEAQAAIYEAADIVIAKVGDVRGSAAQLAKAAVKVRAAMIVESTYFPEANGGKQTAYANYRDEYQELVKEAEAAAEESDANDGAEPDAGDSFGTAASLPEIPEPDYSDMMTRPW